MTRVLHLFDQPDAVGDAAALRLSADAARFDATGNERHAWLLIGGEPMLEAARAAGLPLLRVRLLPRPVGLRRIVPGACRAIRSLLDRADRVECWTPGATVLAGGLSRGHTVPRFGQTTLCGYAGGLIRKAAATPIAANDRNAVRERWGVGEQTVVVAMLADRPERVDAREALLATAFTFETLAAAKAERRDVRLLCHPRAWRRADADGLSRLLRQPQLVLQDASAAAPWRVLAGCDIALAPDPRQAGLSVLWARALGVPVIAPPEPRLPMLAELDALLPAQSAAAKHLAHPLTQWVFAHQHAGLATESYD